MEGELHEICDQCSMYAETSINVLDKVYWAHTQTDKVYPDSDSSNITFVMVLQFLLKVDIFQSHM